MQKRDAETQIWFEFDGKELYGFGLDISEARIVREGKNTIVEYISDGMDGLSKGIFTRYTISAKSVKQEAFKSVEGKREFVKVFRGLTLWGYGN